jgi:bifunctional non-homologous end joining protein LigD
MRFGLGLSIYSDVVLFRRVAFDLLHVDGRDLRRTLLLERRAALRKLIEPNPRCPIQFSDHTDCDGAVFFKVAADLGLGA